MLNYIPYTELGQADHGWLNARHHFSFANYYNPRRMGFGVLRVINDDIIQAGTGFNTHSHQDMEIITFVRSGAITHKDSQGNEGRTEAGDVQVMSAGTGVAHSEFNRESEETTLYQIWIEPNQRGVKPAWKAHEFPKEPTSDKLSLLVAGDGTAPLHIYQDAEIYAGTLKQGAVIDHPIKRQAYLLVSAGEIQIEDQVLAKGDAMEMSKLKSVQIQALSATAEVVVIDAPQS